MKRGQLWIIDSVSYVFLWLRARLMLLSSIHSYTFRTGLEVIKNTPQAVAPTVLFRIHIVDTLKRRSNDTSPLISGQRNVMRAKTDLECDRMF